MSRLPPSSVLVEVEGVGGGSCGGGGGVGALGGLAGGIANLTLFTFGCSSGSSFLAVHLGHFPVQTPPK